MRTQVPKGGLTARHQWPTSRPRPRGAAAAALWRGRVTRTYLGPDHYRLRVDSLSFVSPQFKVVMMIAGVAFGVVDVKQSSDKLNSAMQERSARAIGQLMIVADPFFVAKQWRDHLVACADNLWCYVPPPATHLSRSTGVSSFTPQPCLDNAIRALGGPGDSQPRVSGLSSPSYRDCVSASLNTARPQATAPAAPTAWWRDFWPLSAVRMAVLPVVQSGWSLLNRGWTAHVVFLLSFFAAVLLARSAAERAESVPGTMLASLGAFLAVSIALSFALNLALRAGNFVAGFWGVLVAMAFGIYFVIELVGKMRELLRATGMGAPK